MNPISLSAIHLLESAINAALRQDYPSQKSLQRLTGQAILIEIEDFSLFILVTILDEGIALSLPENKDQIEFDPRKDTHVSGKSRAYSKLLDGNGFFDGELQIQGNAQTLMTLHKVSQNIDLDWEGMLADHIGDMQASIVARLLRKQWRWSRDTGKNLTANLIDYLQNDSELLPMKAEFNNFVEDLESFNTQLDRLEVRLRLLKQK